MPLTKKELVTVSVLVGILLVPTGWLLYNRLSKADQGLVPEQINSATIVVDADAEQVKAEAAAKAYAKAHDLAILSTQAVELVEDGKLQRAVMVSFKGGGQGVYCFADGNCRSERMWQP